LAAAEEQHRKKHAPYSTFGVGAALRGDNGKVLRRRHVATRRRGFVHLRQSERPSLRDPRRRAQDRGRSRVTAAPAGGALRHVPPTLAEVSPTTARALPTIVGERSDPRPAGSSCRSLRRQDLPEAPGEGGNRADGRRRGGKHLLRARTGAIVAFGNLRGRGGLDATG